MAVCGVQVQKMLKLKLHVWQWQIIRWNLPFFAQNCELAMLECFEV
jgi:hypothetical protein